MAAESRISRGESGIGRLAIAAMVVLTGLFVALGWGPAAATAAGVPDIGLEKSTDEEVLFGQDSTVTLRASNPAGQPTGYNTSFRDVLPAGISYVAGSAPATVGEPQILNNAPAAGQTTLIWLNVADLTANSNFEFDFQVSHSTTLRQAGDIYTNQAGAYINCDPRFVPDFGPTGLPVQSGGDGDCSGSDPDQSYTGFATDSADTEIKAIELTKDEPSPEGELLRGVHNHQTVYTLRVDNNHVNPSNDLRVEDYLPAGLEFLGCGNVDNTTDAPTNPGSPQEYAGSGPINPGNEPGGGWQSDCVSPDTVETVENPPGLPAGVYTHVVWENLADLAPSTVFNLRYAAAIPIRANTMDWNGADAGAGTAPGTGGAQIANLDNNSGPETEDEQGLTNFASAGVLYAAPGGPVETSDEDDLTRTAEDIRILKSVDPETLGAGTLSEWTLQIDVGEYRFVDDIVVSVLDFADRWDRKTPLVVHCFAGISRSTASAYIIAAAKAPKRDERELAQELRRLSPTATPNPRIIALADKLLGRQGRMIEAIAAIGRGVDAYEGVPFGLKIDR